MVDALVRILSVTKDRNLTHELKQIKKCKGGLILSLDCVTRKDGVELAVGVVGFGFT